MVSLVNSTKPFKRFHTNPVQIIPKNVREGTLLNSFFKAIIITLRSDKNITLIILMSDENKDTPAA